MTDTNRIKEIRNELNVAQVRYEEECKEYDDDILQNMRAERILKWHKSEMERVQKVDENTSDGYHTFKELYEFRLLYNACFFNKLASTAWICDTHKSKKHYEGDDCFGGGWFIVMAQLPTGQISNHYELKDWDLFQIPEKEKANKWDGHTPKDVADRIREYLTPTNSQVKERGDN